MSQQQLKKHGKTFHFASRFLSKRQLESAAALYAICREIDDLADCTTDCEHARDQLNQLRTALETEDREHPIVQRVMNLSPAVNKAVLIELVDGVISDTHPVAIQSEGALFQYCYQVAGTVGLLMCDLFGVEDPAARHHAVDLGVAMQLTNICRDVLEDAQHGRRYLPETLVGSLLPEQLVDPTESEERMIREAVGILLLEAEARYESGISGLCFLPRSARLGILIAALGYREIGLILADRQFDVWQGRAYTTDQQKLVIAAKSTMRWLFSSRLHHYQGFHDQRLHRPLRQRPGVHWAS